MTGAVCAGLIHTSALRTYVSHDFVRVLWNARPSTSLSSQLGRRFSERGGDGISDVTRPLRRCKQLVRFF